MQPIDKADRVVVNIADAEFATFSVDGKEVPGQGYLQLDESFPPAAGFHIYRMAPGTWTQPHEHTCAEQFLVLEGEVADHDGTVYRKGDFVLLKKGTRHNSFSHTGCTLAVFITSPEINL